MIEEELKAGGFEICLEKIRIAHVPTKEQLEEITEKILSAEF